MGSTPSIGTAKCEMSNDDGACCHPQNQRKASEPRSCFSAESFPFSLGNAFNAFALVAVGGSIANPRQHGDPVVDYLSHDTGCIGTFSMSVPVTGSRILAFICPEESVVRRYL